MAYDKKDIYEKAVIAITKHKLLFIEDVVTFLPCGKTKFYEFFKLESNELNALKDLIEKNKVELKVSMRNKWYRSQSPPLQLALYKLMATPEEAKKLSMTYQETEHSGEIKGKTTIVFTKGAKAKD